MIYKCKKIFDGFSKWIAAEAKAMEIGDLSDCLVWGFFEVSNAVSTQYFTSWT